MDKFDNVWDALEDDPIKAKNLKLRSSLLTTINKHIDTLAITQTELAKMLKITQPRANALRQGKISQFRLDSLVNFASILGLRVKIDVAA